MKVAKIRLTTAGERALAQEIRDTEDQIRTALMEVPVAAAVLAVKPKHSKPRTHSAEVEHLQSALELAKAASRKDTSQRAAVRRACAAEAQAENLRWRLAMSAVQVVKPLAKKISGLYVEEEDLMHEGYIGLLNAATRFDPSRDIKFATYAKWWVRAQMSRAVDAGGRPVRLTGCAVEQMRNIRRAKERFEAEQVEYTVADLAIETGIKENRIKLLLRSQQEFESLDSRGSGDRSFAEVFPDEEVDVEEEVSQRLLRQRIRHLIDTLQDERDRFVLVRRYGLDDGRFRKLSEVGDEMGLSRERVRQIEKRALLSIQAAMV